MPTVDPHVGDGRFQNISWRFPWHWGIPVPGFSIDFPEFDLSNAFEASYRLENVPHLSRPAYIYLSILDPAKAFRSDESRQKLVAEIEFELLDENGTVVAQLRQPLARLVWAQPEGGDYGLYHIDDSDFVPRKGARYRLHVHYTPDPALKGLKGFVHIRCGGSA